MNSHVRHIASVVDPALLASVLLLLTACGCDSGVQRVVVSGKVVIDGEPLSKGTIRFVPAKGRAASSVISANGSFRVAMKSLSKEGTEVVGLVPGNYRIDVSSTESLGESEQAEVRWLVPRRYGNFRTSGLEADIQAPTDSLIVELTWEGAEETDTEIEAEAGTEDSLNEEDQETQEKPKSDA